MTYHYATQAELDDMGRAAIARAERAIHMAIAALDRTGSEAIAYRISAAYLERGLTGAQAELADHLCDAPRSIYTDRVSAESECQAACGAIAIAVRPIWALRVEP